MFSISNLGKYYGAQTLFSGASYQFNKGCRYGIVGANGSGKSTLLKILSGLEEASEGSVDIPKRVQVGVLKQDHFAYETTSILDVVLQGIAILYSAMAEKEAILENAHNHFDGDRYSILEDIIIAHDGYTIEARAGEILEGLGIPTSQHHQPMSILSGGFKFRVLLAQTLASKPDLLLLDEPTNHLDIISVKWLENFLQDFRGCALIVSHDREFLDSVCTHIVDVDYLEVNTYIGNYSAFEISKAEHRERKEQEIKKRQQEIEKHKVFIERFRYKATKARQAQSRIKQMNKIIIEPLPTSSRRHPKFSLKQRRASGKMAIEIRNIYKAYEEKEVLKDINFNILRGDRVAIIGPNGVGKSTLLKIIMDVIKADAGSFEWGYETHLGYFSQDHREVHDRPNDSVHEWLWSIYPTLSIGEIRGRLAAVLFTKDEVEKKLHALSGGESTRLLFAHLGALQPNVLILDEPTNHLDIEGIESLAEGLKSFDGTLIVVSHNRWFVSQLANRVIEITPDKITDYAGTYDEFIAYNTVDHLSKEAVLKKEKQRLKNSSKKKQTKKNKSKQQNPKEQEKVEISRNRESTKKSKKKSNDPQNPRAPRR